MSLEELAPDEVLAVRFDDPALAQALADWCGGLVESTDLGNGDRVTTLRVPTPRGPRTAVFGDWVVRRGPEHHIVMDGPAFLASHRQA